MKLICFDIKNDEAHLLSSTIVTGDLRISFIFLFFNHLMHITADQANASSLLFYNLFIQTCFSPFIINTDNPSGIHIAGRPD